MSEEQILEDFPELEKEDIRAVLQFAADLERKLTTQFPLWSTPKSNLATGRESTDLGDCRDIGKPAR